MDRLARFLTVKKGRTLEDIMDEFDIGERTAYKRISQLRVDIDDGEVEGHFLRDGYAPVRYRVLPA